MDAFETLVAQLMQREGYWVINSFKVELTKAEKKEIGRPSSPRWELDLIAYNPQKKNLRIIECKSYLDSIGVKSKSFSDGAKLSGRYKLFTDIKLRQIVFSRLKTQLEDMGMILENTNIQLCLAAGKVATDTDRKELHEIFSAKQWLLFDEEWIISRLRILSSGRYDNTVESIVSKLIYRNMKL
jgi:hypothetical protein